MENNFQGRRPDQVEFSQKVGGYALLAFVVILIATAVLELIVKYK